ncbi:MAG: alpha/beta hydrolase [Actinomycetota bacterium]
MGYIYRSPSGVTFSDRAELDKSYDVEGAVDDFSEYVKFFVEGSAQARNELSNTLDVRYGPTRHETLDIFHGAPDGPVVIFIHGGYWKSLSSREFSLVAPGLVKRGATVVVPNYALLPNVTIDEIVRQMRTAVSWTYANIAAYGADPHRILLSGHSAGGHLTAMLLNTDWEEEYGLTENPIAAGCSISGLFDLRPLYYTWMQREFQFAGDEVLRNSPILNLPESSPHLLITHGDNQPSEFRRQSSDFYDAWTHAGLPGEYWVRDGLNHFDELEAFGDPESDLVHRMIKLVSD